MQPDADRSIAIIGGGITGVTTAVLLQMLGYQTVLYTRGRPSHEPGANRPAEFATLHAAASVLPHSVVSPHINRWMGISQAFFRTVAFQGSCGVRRQVHYEMFEDAMPAVPVYANSIDNFELLTSEELNASWVPRRSGAASLGGWKFDVFFCDAPEYLYYLYELYRAGGGQVLDAPGDGDLAAYLALDHLFYVNCAGAAAPSFLEAASLDARLFDAPAPPDFERLLDVVPGKLIRGHYLRVGIPGVPVGHRGGYFSYSYKPAAEVYRSASGIPADVYCYPRSDAWVLGGSRQEGRADSEGNWIGEQTVGDEIEFPRASAPPVAVPAAVFRLNADILRRMTGGRLELERLVRDDPGMVVPGIGYRFVRDSDTDSVRIGCSRLNYSGAPKYILHNYGHGGAGFSLSWGCAFDVLRLLGRVADAPPRPAGSAGNSRFTIRYAATHRLLFDLATSLLADGG